MRLSYSEARGRAPSSTGRNRGYASTQDPPSTGPPPVGVARPQVWGGMPKAPRNTALIVPPASTLQRYFWAFLEGYWGAGEGGGHKGGSIEVVRGAARRGHEALGRSR